MGAAFFDDTPACQLPVSPAVLPGMCPFRVTFVAASAFALIAAAPTIAQPLTADDGRGNAVYFQVDAPGATVDDELALLKRLPHGPEISRVVIRIVPPASIGAACGSSGAAACYSGRSNGTGRITVPDIPAAGSGEHSLAHEYGHHIDNTYRHTAAPEPNGTSSWWRARGMSELAASGVVARDYSRGWDHSIAEIFAEDYAQLTLDTPWRLRWLAPPGEAVLNAIRADLGSGAGGPGVPPPTPTPTPAPSPTVPAGPPPFVDPPVAAPVPRGVDRSTRRMSRRGSLAARRSVVVRVPLTGTGNRIRLAARFVGGRAQPGRLSLVCNRRRLAMPRMLGGRIVRVNRSRLNTGFCTVRITNLGRTPTVYAVTITIRRADAR